MSRYFVQEVYGKRFSGVNPSNTQMEYSFGKLLRDTSNCLNNVKYIFITC